MFPIFSALAIWAPDESSHQHLYPPKPTPLAVNCKDFCWSQGICCGWEPPDKDINIFYRSKPSVFQLQLGKKECPMAKSPIKILP